MRVRVTRPSTADAARRGGQIGTVISDWVSHGADGHARGYLVEFPDGEVLRVLLAEVDELDA